MPWVKKKLKIIIELYVQVRNLPPRSNINYTELAREHNLYHTITKKIPSNGGQIMEAILDKSDLDMSQFEKAPNSGPKNRRAKRK